MTNAWKSETLPLLLMLQLLVLCSCIVVLLCTALPILRSLCFAKFAIIMIDSGKKARIQIYIALSCLPLFYAKSETMIKHDSNELSIPLFSIFVLYSNSILYHIQPSANFRLTHLLIHSQMCCTRISFLFSIQRTRSWSRCWSWTLLLLLRILSKETNLCLKTQWMNFYYKHKRITIWSKCELYFGYFGAQKSKRCKGTDRLGWSQSWDQF